MEGTTLGHSSETASWGPVRLEHGWASRFLEPLLLLLQSTSSPSGFQQIPGEPVLRTGVLNARWSQRMASPRGSVSWEPFGGHSFMEYIYKFPDSSKTKLDWDSGALFIAEQLRLLDWFFQTWDQSMFWWKWLQMFRKYCRSSYITLVLRFLIKWGSELWSVEETELEGPSHPCPISSKCQWPPHPVHPMFIPDITSALQTQRSRCLLESAAWKPLDHL